MYVCIRTRTKITRFLYPNIVFSPAPSNLPQSPKVLPGMSTSGGFTMSDFKICWGYKFFQPQFSGYLLWGGSKNGSTSKSFNFFSLWTIQLLDRHGHINLLNITFCTILNHYISQHSSPHLHQYIPFSIMSIFRKIYLHPSDLFPSLQHKFPGDLHHFPLFFSPRPAPCPSRRPRVLLVQRRLLRLDLAGLVQAVQQRQDAQLLPEAGVQAPECAVLLWSFR